MAEQRASQRRPERVFVAGATGYTGRAVVEACVRDGAAAVAHVRPDSPRLAEWRAHFQRLGAEVDTTPWEDAAMRATMVRLEPTHVMALLGTTRSRARAAALRGEPAESYRSVDYGLTHLLIEAAVGAAAVTGVRGRLIYLSAVGAREETRNSYLRVRGVVERELGESGLPYLAIRPSFITGNDRDETRRTERWTARIMDALLAPLALAGGRRLRDRYRSVSGAELGYAVARLALEDSGNSRVVPMDELRRQLTRPGHQHGTGPDRL